MDSTRWPMLKQKLTALFKTRPREEWCSLMEMTDVCFAPVLSMAEAPVHPHNAARQTFVDVGGMTQPAPAPRYSATPNGKPSPAARAGADTDAVRSACGFSAADR